MIRRVNFYGGPGSGKSTAALCAASWLKKMGCRGELAREFVKHWTYYERLPSKWDQVHIFGQQIQEESLLLENGIDVAVCECPLLLNCWYAQRLPEVAEHLVAIAQDFEKQFPAIHVLVTRGSSDLGYKYDPVGRFKEHSEDMLACIDDQIRDFVEEQVGKDKLRVLTVPWSDREMHNILLETVGVKC